MLWLCRVSLSLGSKLLLMVLIVCVMVVRLRLFVCWLVWFWFLVDGGVIVLVLCWFCVEV